MRETSENQANRLREYREKRHWTQEELGARAGVHWSYVSHLEQARRSGTFATRYRLARALGEEYTTVFPPVLEAAYLAGREKEIA